MYASVFACSYVYMSAVSQGGQKRVSSHQMLELQMVVSCSAWVPESELRSSARACALPF